ncbi:Uncharacterised protein [Mycobacterium tuberculosis]|uniref:Uncharacterized protein n=1 Tax=Mycobacterium tuberculosis TaxID=1773 RepID=A0A654TWB0_MYCTX|nr:Uncharacterised protein [Mycobacterium tuberculosis]
MPHDITANPNNPKWVSANRLPTSIPIPASSGNRASNRRTAVISSSAPTTASGSSRSAGSIAVPASTSAVGTPRSLATSHSTRVAYTGCLTSAGGGRCPTRLS